MRRGLLLVLSLALLSLPHDAPAQTNPLAACGEPQTSIAWTQPPRRPIDDPAATRWPVDGTIRIAYAGTQCPDASEFELFDEAGRQVPAQIRVDTPSALVTNDELPVTIIEIDPVAHLAPRAAHTLVWRAPDPKLAAFADYTLEFKTLARRMLALPLDDFEGAIAVQQRDGPCGAEFGNPVFLGAGETNVPGCPTEDRLLVQVRFKPINRRDIAYRVERSRSTPFGDDGELQPDQAETDPVVVALVGGGEDADLQQQLDAFIQISVPATPLPRRDCFRVRLVDAVGQPQGGEGEACIDLVDDLPCIDPPIVASAPLPDPQPVALCRAIGLNGADPDVVPPFDGPDADPADPGDPPKNSDGCCRTTGGPAPWWLAPCLVLGLIRRR